MGTPYVLECTHLCLDETNRMQSAEIINNRVKEIQFPSILVGDMNCESNSNPYKKLMEVWDSTWGAKPIPTFPADNPTSDIDHCFTYPKNAWKVQEIKVIESDASDHRPLKITLKLNK